MSAVLEGYRRGLADSYADDILMLAHLPARENADRNGVLLTVVLRILVPHFCAKGLNAREIAEQLRVSERSVVRHRARMKVP